jgi:hypothetical protein
LGEAIRSLGEIIEKNAITDLLQAVDGYFTSSVTLARAKR